MPADSANCPKCHTPLPPAAPHGLCPACLMDAAAGDADTLPSADAFGAPLDLEALRRAFPQLEILAPLGAGGMGRVYKVRQPHLDRVVALKVVPPAYTRDPAWVERFTREARALARLNHPNIVQVYDFGQTAESPGSPPLCWLLMEYVDGVSLRQVQRTGGLSSREALALIPKLCDALQYAHEKGVLHRDIKPENILLDAAGTVKIADFGLAKLGGTAESPTLTLTGARLGTAAYMAPEQIESPADVDHRADIYSLGVVFYELLTGGLPLGRFPAPSEKSGTDPRLDHIVFRTLEKERDRRYQAAGEIRTALNTVAASPQPPPLPKDAPPGTPQAWDFHRVPTPAGADALKVKPEPRLHRTTRPLTGGEPPVPPENVVKVTYRERSAPGSGSEALGYGCGWAWVGIWRLALAAAPFFLPMLWYEVMGEWRSNGAEQAMIPHSLWMAAATGLLAWWLAHPLMKLWKLPERECVKRRAPLIFLLAAVLWAAALVPVASAVKSFPNTGVSGILLISAQRDFIAEGGIPLADDALQKSWDDSVQEAFADSPNSIAENSEYTRSAIDRVLSDTTFYRAESRRGKVDPTTFRLMAAGTSVAALNARLDDAARRFLARLPLYSRLGVNVEVVSAANHRNDFSYSYSPRRLAVSLDYFDNMVWIGLLMTSGGWLAALAGGSKPLRILPPVMLVGASALLAVARPVWVPGGMMVAAPAPQIESMPARSDTADPELGPEAAFMRWVNACQRLDREAAGSQMSAPNDSAWQSAAGFWNTNRLLSFHVEYDSPPGKATLRFLSLSTPRVPKGDFYSSAGGRHGSDRWQKFEPRSGHAAQVKLTETEGGWKIEGTIITDK